MEGRKNKNYSEQLARFNRAFKEGSEEFALRYAPILVERCDNAECMNSVAPALDTYWLCELCSRRAPDVIQRCIHCPLKTLVSKQKQVAANAASLCAEILLSRARQKVCPS